MDRFVSLFTVDDTKEGMFFNLPRKENWHESISVLGIPFQMQISKAYSIYK